jgi:RES domain
MISPPVTALRRFDTHRLLPAKYSPNYDSVLTRIADNDQDLQHIFELDNATNGRIQAEEGLSPGISPKELVFKLPNYRIINAAFTHANPLGARFSTPERGAWYAGFELATSKAEVLFHKSVEFAEIDWQAREEIEYDDYLADFSASFHDLRPEALASAAKPKAEGENQQRTGALDPEMLEEILSPDSYVRSQQLAVQLLDQGSLGIIYPSVRRAGGTCLACFRPGVVSNVRKNARFKLIWTPARARFVRQEWPAILGNSEEDNQQERIQREAVQPAERTIKRLPA